MTNGIRKLRREADIILELLNMASEPYLPINIEEGVYLNVASVAIAMYYISYDHVIIHYVTL